MAKQDSEASKVTIGKMKAKPTLTGPYYLNKLPDSTEQVEILLRENPALELYIICRVQDKELAAEWSYFAQHNANLAFLNANALGNDKLPSVIQSGAKPAGKPANAQLPLPQGEPQESPS